MIRKLRYKFIALSMAVLFLVLLIILGSINILNYRNIVSEADSILAVLKENDGKFPIENALPRNDIPKEDILQEGDLASEKQENPMGMGRLNHLSPEIPYESRYFSVALSEDGSITSVDTGKIAAIDTETAMDYAKELWENGKEKGFIDNYRYIQCEEETGRSRIIFLDCTRNLLTFQTFLLTSLGISLIGMLAVLILIILLSKRIVRPVSESYDKQKQFITDAGHELKTPLTIIDADAEVLAMELGENEWIEDIQRQTKRLASLTNNLVYLSRMEEENNVMQMIEFPISDVISESAEDFQTIAKSGEKTFHVQIQPLLAIKGDEKAIRQLISILLDNAMKYTAAGGTVELNLNRQGKHICLEVSNETDAVKKEDLPYLFDRFYRADASRNSQTGGYGIGLSIARAIVITHKGKITADMKSENNLTIRIMFPV